MKITVQITVQSDEGQAEVVQELANARAPEMEPVARIKLGARRWRDGTPACS
jgi:hypothetical protein